MSSINGMFAMPNNKTKDERTNPAKAMLYMLESMSCL